MYVPEIVLHRIKQKTKKTQILAILTFLTQSTKAVFPRVLRLVKVLFFAVFHIA